MKKKSITGNSAGISAGISTAIYLRASSDKQDASVPEQRAAITAYAKQHGFRIVSEYVDDGISGDDTHRRTSFQQMIADAGKAQWRKILVWDLARLGRFDVLEAGRWLSPLRDAGVIVHTLDKGDVDWSDFAGRIVWAVEQEAHNSYLKTLARNTARGKQQKVATIRKRMGGQPPYGYRSENRELVLDEGGTLDVLLWIVDQYLEKKKSLRTICYELNQRGTLTNRGKLWAVSALSDMLKNPVLIGTLRYGHNPTGKYVNVEGVQVFPDNHPAALSKDVFEKLQAELKRRSVTREGEPETFKYPLSGLVNCGRCGWRMVIQHQTKKTRDKKTLYLMCRRRHLHGMCDAPLVNHWWVLDRLVEFIGNKEKSGVHCSVEEAREYLKKKLQRKGNQKSKADSAKRGLQQLEAKIRSSQQRLLEVSREFIPLVEDQLRGLLAEREKLQTKMQRDEKQEDLNQLDRVAQASSEFTERITSMINQRVEYQSIRRALAAIFSRIEVTSQGVEQAEFRVFLWGIERPTVFSSSKRIAKAASPAPSTLSSITENPTPGDSATQPSTPKERSPTPRRKTPQSKSTPQTTPTKETQQPRKSTSTKPLTKVQQREILELIGKGASPAGACQKVGVDVGRFYHTLQKSQTLQVQLEEVYQAMNQNVEVALYHAAMKGNVSAQTLWLKNRPPPGWTTRRETQGSERWDNFTDEELVELARAEGLSIPPELVTGTETPRDPKQPGDVST